MTADQIIERFDLENRRWIRKSFNGVLHYFYICGDMVMKPLKYHFGVKIPLSIFYFHDDIGDWYWDKATLEQTRDAFLKKVKEEPKIFDEMISDWRQSIDILEQQMQKVDQTDLGQLSDDELIALYNRWYQAYLDEYALSANVPEGFSLTADEHLIPHFLKIIKEKIPQVDVNASCSLLLSAIKDSFATKERKDLLRLRLKMKDPLHPSEEEWDLLQQHAHQYHWVNNNYSKSWNYDAEHFRKQIEDVSVEQAKRELQEGDEHLQQTVKDKQELIDQLDLDDYSRLLIRITETFSFVQDERKKYAMISVFYHDRFVNELVNRLPLSKEEVQYTYIHEVADLLKNKDQLDPKVYHERRQSALVVHTTTGSCELYPGEVGKQVFDRVFKVDVTGVTELRGTVASKGKATGTVKVVTKIEHVKNVQQGDVIVATMTRPFMTAAMGKAVAIVTDEGGITSHAAVVSRELGIPCIIGTKVATKVLKDGDQVEVDAEKGIVKKI